MLKDNIKKIFNNYLRARNEQFSNHPIAIILRHEIPNDLKNMIKDPDKYKFSGSAGQGNWTHSPWVGVFNKKITESAQRGYYIVYLFREDMEGVYISLNQGMTEIRNQSANNAEAKEILENRASNFRKQLNDQVEDDFLKDIDLGVENSPNAPYYEAGNIYSKYYPKNDLPSEEVLETDFKEILRLYNLLADEGSILKVIEDPQEIKEAQDKFLKILQDRADERIVTENIKIGLSEKEEVEAYWSNDLGFWVVNRDLQLGNRYFNGFGIKKPDNKAEAICEINIEKNGINRKTAGAFAKDSEGNIYLIHRGKVGTNLKDDLLNKFADNVLDIKDGDVEARVILIGGLNDLNFPEKVRDFVYTVAKVKDVDVKSNKNSEDLYVIENSNKISKAQDQFLNTILSHVTENVNGRAGFQGGAEEGVMHWADDLNMWIVSRKIENSRYWNGFGVDKPVKGRGYTITAEINFPLKGIKRNIGGVFVQGEEDIFVAHRGNLGGNYSKKFFIENYKGKWTKIKDGDRESEFVLIGGLKDPNLPEKISQFIYEVDRMKTGKNTDQPLNEYFFDYLMANGYKFSPNLIENFLLSLKIKPFVILTGNSGTGKTKLAQLFAKYIDQKNAKNKDFISTKVKPNLSSIKYGAWTLDRSDLEPLNLDLEKKFQVNIDGLYTTAKLSMSPRLWYDDPDGKIKAKLEALANNNFNSEIELKLITGLKDSSKYDIIPIGANWTENRHLLGFYNVINKNYQTTDALNLILSAIKDNNKPYFLILDEMNLSHVERYFADFLSAMESNESIPLHFNKKEELIPSKLDLPKNLHVIGTVNVDETTYMFSPKVLDRANTIEFKTYPARKYILSQFDNNDAFSGDLKYLENPLSDLEVRYYTIKQLEEKFADVKISTGYYLWDFLASEIQSFQDVLGKAGFDFGFRVINEILRFMYVAWVYEGKPELWDNFLRYFDAQIKQKMLPKLHGSQRVLENVLKELFKLCYIEEVDPSPRYFKDLETDSNVKYLSSALKIKEMDKVLNEQRYVSFIN